MATFSGETLSFPNFSHSLNNFQGFITFRNGQFVLQSFTAEMGTGRMQGNGYVAIEDAQVKDLNFNLIGKEMVLYPMDRTHCKLNADLTLKYLNRQLLLQGTLNFLSATWEREIEEGISFYTRSELSPAESKILDLLQLDIKLIGEDDVWMNNSLGKIRGKFNLQLTGTNEFPILTGTIESRSGEIFFSDRPFSVLKAKLVFSNKYFIDPLVNIESETFIQNYRIRFDIKGTTQHPKPEFVSSPPLPPQDILALISLGEMFKRSGSTEYSSQMGSTAMISSKLTENIKNRANKILGIDLLRLDPLLTGQSSISTSRLTIGKSIGKDLIVVYSTNLASSKQEILYFQYQLSSTLSLIGMKNEDGKYSLDFALQEKALAFCCCWRCFRPLRGISLQNAKIHRIFMVFDGRQNPADWNTYSPLIHIHTGDDYNGQRIKASLENLFKTDDFSNIEAKVERVTEETIDLYFVLQRKIRVHSITFKPDRHEEIKSKELRRSVFSLRKGDIYEEYNLEKAVSELQAFLKSRGFFAAQVKTGVNPVAGKKNGHCVPDRVRQTGHDPQSDHRDG